MRRGRREVCRTEVFGSDTWEVNNLLHTGRFQNIRGTNTGSFKDLRGRDRACTDYHEFLGTNSLDALICFRTDALIMTEYAPCLRRIPDTGSAL